MRQGGPLAGELPKGAVLLVSAVFFGAAHADGVPSGVIFSTIVMLGGA